jgi:hypothetical protein
MIYYDIDKNLTLSKFSFHDIINMLPIVFVIKFIANIGIS